MAVDLIEYGGSTDTSDSDSTDSTTDSTTDYQTVEDSTSDSTTTSDSGGMATDIANDAESAYGGNQVPGDQETTTDDANADPDLTDDGANQGTRVPAGEPLWYEQVNTQMPDVQVAGKQIDPLLLGALAVVAYGGYKAVGG